MVDPYQTLQPQSIWSLCWLITKSIDPEISISKQYRTSSDCIVVHHDIGLQWLKGYFLHIQKSGYNYVSEMILSSVIVLNIRENTVDPNQAAPEMLLQGTASSKFTLLTQAHMLKTAFFLSTSQIKSVLSNSYKHIGQRSDE